MLFGVASQRPGVACPGVIPPGVTPPGVRPGVASPSASCVSQNRDSRGQSSVATLARNDPPYHTAILLRARGKIQHRLILHTRPTLEECLCECGGTHID
eukprot:1036129-Prorocentrum_minimum.AAC.2